jgi:hypothetical protein
MLLLSLAAWRVLSISLQMRNLTHYIFKLPSDCKEARKVIHVGKRALGRNTANCVLLNRRNARTRRCGHGSGRSYAVMMWCKITSQVLSLVDLTTRFSGGREDNERWWREEKARNCQGGRQRSAEFETQSEQFLGRLWHQSKKTSHFICDGNTYHVQ